MTVRDYSTTAGDNTSISGIGISDTMLANILDNVIRQQMADSADFLLDVAEPTATTGSANAYDLTTSGTVASYEDKIRLVFLANFTNTGACTLNVDALGDVDLKIYNRSGIADLTAGQIQSGGVYDVLYVSAISDFVVLNPTLGYEDYDTVALLLASTESTRGAGAIWEAGGFRYIEVASGGDVTNSAGTPVQLDVLPNDAGQLPVLAFGPVFDGTTDDTTELQAAIATGADLVWPTGETLITGQLVGIGAWYGQGNGPVYSSTYAGMGTFIRTSGTNSGNAFLIPPPIWTGFHVTGDTKQGTGVQYGVDGSFVAFGDWTNIHIRNFAIGLDVYNIYSTSWKNIVVQGNVRGVRMEPADGAGDDAYITSTDWTNVHIADNDVYGLSANFVYGSRTWEWTNVVIERNGQTGGTAQAHLTNVTIVGNGIYLEGSNTIPAIINTTSNLFGTYWFFNDTGGMDAGSSTLVMDITFLRMAQSTDVFANLNSNCRIDLKHSSVQTDLRTEAAISSLEETYIVSTTTTVANRQKQLSIGSGRTLNAIPRDLTYTYVGRKTYTGSIASGGFTRIVTNQYVPGIMDGGAGIGSVDQNLQGLVVQVGPASTGSTDYFCVDLINTTGTIMSVTSLNVTVVILRGNYETL